MFSPSVYEVMQAEKYFLEEYERHKEVMALPPSHPAHMPQKIAIGCAAANVWKHARQYQKEKTEEKRKDEKILNEIMNISGVECYEKDGTAYLKLETVARGLGFTRIAESGNEVVRWERVHKYLDEIGFMPTSGHDGFSQEVAKTDFIPENIFYRLAMKAKNETAERFQALVADEIIPSIRKHGGYIANQEKLTPEQIVANALIVAQNIISAKDKQIEQMKPKAEFFDAVADSGTAISMNEVAKVLGIKGYGRNNLFEFLRNNGILDRWNVPYQRYIDCGWFRVIEQRYTRQGEQCVTTKTLVYQKGVDAIRKKILEAEKTA